MEYTPKINLGADRFKLHKGPYKTPRFRIGQTVVDASRGEVTIVGVTDGRIPWPIGKTKRAKTLVMFRGLANALRNESNTAICHWWGPVRRCETPAIDGASVGNEHSRDVCDCSA